MLRVGCDQIDVAAAVSEPTFGDLPTVNGEPSLRDALALQSKCLSRF